MVEDPAIIESAAKRCLDAGLALIGLLVSLPVWVVISVAIWLEDGGPIFFIQQRVGKGGREFTAYKFRTIYKRFDREMAGVAATHANDHRVMRLGRLLRRTALNELPQLLNILRGDMSFVGPRPEPPEFLDRYEESVPHMRQLRYQLRPGLTGIAQLFGKHNSRPRDKLRYDLLYMRRRTLGLDLKLIGLSIWNTLCARWDA
jgi:lipopolysaccharide/colanic/teichoic acid biosynthesis glycosyltransferase